MSQSFDASAYVALVSAADATRPVCFFNEFSHNRNPFIMTAYVPSKSLGVATTTSVGILALAFCRSTTFGALQPLAQPCLPRARIGLARRPGSRRQSQRLLGARPHPWAPHVIMPLAKRVPLGHAAVLGEAALPSPGAMTRALLLQPQARMRYFLATATGKAALPLQPPSQCQIEFGSPRQ